MRDYNKIQFRSPTRKPNNNTKQRVVEHPLATPATTVTPYPDEKRASEASIAPASTTSTAATTNTFGEHREPSPQHSGMTAADALLVRRDGAEATISRLRGELQETASKDASSKTALAKSDAVILELRSSIRQPKRRLEKVQQEKLAAEKGRQAAESELYNLASNNLPDLSSSDAKDARVGELKVQLD